MRKTSSILLGVIMAFSFIWSIPTGNYAMASGSCAACKIGPNAAAAAGYYDPNMAVAWSCTVGVDGDCQFCCDKCEQYISCATCIDKKGCDCWTLSGIVCKGVPQAAFCESPI